MQLPSALKDWLMFLASVSVAPVAPERDTRSLPARSTRFSWLTLLVEWKNAPPTPWSVRYAGGHSEGSGQAHTCYRSCLFGVV